MRTPRPDRALSGSNPPAESQRLRSSTLDAAPSVALVSARSVIPVGMTPGGTTVVRGDEGAGDDVLAGDSAIAGDDDRACGGVIAGGGAVAGDEAIAGGGAITDGAWSSAIQLATSRPALCASGTTRS